MVKKKKQEIDMKKDIKKLNGKERLTLVLSVLGILIVTGVVLFILIKIDGSDKKEIPEPVVEDWKTVEVIKIPQEEIDNEDIDYHEYCISDTKDYSTCLWTKVEEDTITATESGRKYIYYRAIYKDGTEGITELYNAYIDNDKPVIENVEQLEEETLTVRVKAHDNTSSVEKYLYSLDGKEYNEGKMTQVFKDLNKNNAYILYITVVDKAGNTAQTAVQIGNKSIILNIPTIEE